MFFFFPAPFYRTLQVVIKYAATVDLGALQSYIAGDAMDEEVPRSAVQVLEVVMRSGVSGEERWEVWCRGVDPGTA